MKNQYFGDVGDFGKYGLLSSVIGTGLNLGINWYLTPDEPHRNDGKYTEYLENKPNYLECDPELYLFLRKMVSNIVRNVDNIRQLPRFANIPAFNEELDVSTLSIPYRIAERKRWFSESMRYLKDCDIVFLDPDNGLEVKSVPATSQNSNKYVLYDEAKKISDAGKSIIIYNHRDRSEENEYRKRIKKLRDIIQPKKITVIRFKRYSVRDYIFVIQDQHEAAITNCLQNFLESEWGGLHEHLIK